jgi:hypothetical protein
MKLDKVKEGKVLELKYYDKMDPSELVKQLGGNLKVPEFK